MSKVETLTFFLYTQGSAMTKQKIGSFLDAEKTKLIGHNIMFQDTSDWICGRLMTFIVHKNSSTILYSTKTLVGENFCKPI